MDLVYEFVGSRSEIHHDLGLFLAEADHRVQDAGDVPERDAWDDEYRKLATVSPKLGWFKKHMLSYDLTEVYAVLREEDLPRLAIDPASNGVVGMVGDGILQPFAVVLVVFHSLVSMVLHPVISMITPGIRVPAWHARGIGSRSAETNAHNAISIHHR